MLVCFGVQLLPECGDERGEGLVKRLLYRFHDKLAQTLLDGAEIAEIAGAVGEGGG